jgi:hypothetical protein
MDIANLAGKAMNFARARVRICSERPHSISYSITGLMDCEIGCYNFNKQSDNKPVIAFSIGQVIYCLQSLTTDSGFQSECPHVGISVQQDLSSESQPQ